MSKATESFENTFGHLYPKMTGRNLHFVDYDNPNAEVIKDYMLSLGATVGWNTHELGHYCDDDSGCPMYCAEKPVWVFQGLTMSKRAFTKLLKEKNWLKK